MIGSNDFQTDGDSAEKQAREMAANIEGTEIDTTGRVEVQETAREFVDPQSVTKQKPISKRSAERTSSRL